MSAFIKTGKRLLSVAGYPGYLLANGAYAAWAIGTGQDLGLAALFGLFGSLAYLIILERALPYRREWHADWREWVRDAVYFGVNGAVDALTNIALVALSIWVAARLDWGAASLPLWLSIPLAVLIADFTSYWLHRKSHDIPWLWKVHGVHHAPDKVNAFNNNTVHFLNTAFSGAAKMLPILALGFSAEAVYAAGLFITIQTFGVHVNAELNLGFLNHFIMGPEHHRLHHSLVLEEAGNHAPALTLWDRVFGTFTWRPGLAPKGVGIGGGIEFPEPNRIVENQLFPFLPEPLPVFGAVSEES